MTPLLWRDGKKILPKERGKSRSYGAIEKRFYQKSGVSPALMAR